MNTDNSDYRRDDQRPLSDALSTDGRRDELSSPLHVLLIDDNRQVAESLAVALRLAGHAIDHAADPEEAMSRLAARRYHAILLDLNYAAGRTDGAEGLLMLDRIIADDPAACVVVITAHSGIRVAVEAMRIGASDFVMKPWRNADLLAKLTRAATRTTKVGIAASCGPGAEPIRLIGESPRIARVRDLIRRIGPTTAGVIVTGASGTGRGFVAAALHASSTRAATPMIRVDLRDADAWVRIDAAAGTLLLRHPDCLDEPAQRQLLDRLPDDVRCIAVADDARAIEPALARRIAAVDIAIPRLADRGDDILLLARHFVRLFADRHGRPAPMFTPAAEAAIRASRWRDEVRGLASAVERAVLLGDGGEIDVALLSQERPCSPPPSDDPRSRFDLDASERAMIEAALREHHHNVTHAAAALGLSRGALYRRMARHGF